jgi:uncharacterized protein
MIRATVLLAPHPFAPCRSRCPVPSAERCASVSSSLVSVLLLGLLAGGVSCAAAQGGLLAALAARHRAASPSGTRARDDLTPVGGFLAGKLLSHTALGLLLGAVGTAVRPGPQLRASVQIGAGLLIVVMGLAQLGPPALGRLLTAPAAWAGPARRAVRSASALAPAALGAATVLIPCGATLSVMALAVADQAWLRVVG